MKKSFSDFFPLPQFLEMSPAGLAISDSSVHLVELVKKRHGLVLGKFGTMKIPAGAIKEGYINDKDAVVSVLKSLKQKLSIESVSVSLPDEKAYLFTTKIPKSSGTDLRQAIEFRLEENVPLSEKDAVFDFAVMPNPADKDVLEVSVSVLPYKVSESYVDIVKLAGFEPMSLCLEAEALRRSVVPFGNLGTFMIVNVDENRTSLTITNRGVAQFNITVPSGGRAITAAIAKHLSVGIEEAVKIKEERGFVKNPSNVKLFVSVMDAVLPIKDEIGKLIMYWQTHKIFSNQNAGKIEKIILCGKDCNLVGFDDYISSSTKIPIEVANVWQNAFSYDDYVPNISFNDSLDYASAVGLALKHKL